MLTNSAWCANAKDDDIATTSMIEQFNELVQHDGYGGNTHAMLSETSKKYINYDATEKSDANPQQIKWYVRCNSANKIKLHQII